MPKPIPARPSPSQAPRDAPGSPSRPNTPMGVGMGGPGTPAGDQPAESVRPDLSGMGSPVGNLVWSWLVAKDRQVLLYSDVTKGLCGPRRKVSRLSPSPRQAIRDALYELADEGLVVLRPVGGLGHGTGRPGTQIEIASAVQPMSPSTQESRS